MRQEDQGREQELAYADDEVVTAETEQEARESFERWKEAMETRGLRMNMEKTKVMITEKHTRVKL